MKLVTQHETVLKMRVEKRVPRAFVSILSVCVCGSNRAQKVRLI